MSRLGLASPAELTRYSSSSVWTRSRFPVIQVRLSTSVRVRVAKGGDYFLRVSP